MPDLSTTAVRPGEERRLWSLPDAELREPGTPENGGTTLQFTGHAAVFNVRSLPLWDWWYGEYREVVEPGFFRPVLDSRDAAPLDVHLVYQHDMGSSMADTLSSTLELREDEIGLRVWAELDPEDVDVQRVRPKMRRLRQMSFAFTVERDRWVIENEGSDEEVVTRYLVEGRELFDVSIVPQGAYPQTDATLRSMQRAVERGEIPARLLGDRAGEIPAGPSSRVAPDGPAGAPPSIAPGTPVGGTAAQRLRAARARARVVLATTPDHGGTDR